MYITHAAENQLHFSLVIRGSVVIGLNSDLYGLPKRGVVGGQVIPNIICLS